MNTMFSLNKMKVIVGICLSIVIFTESLAVPLDKTYFRLDSLEGNGERFLAGVYMYRATTTRNDPNDGKGWDELSLDAHFRWLSQLGINLIHTDDIRMKNRDDTSTFLQLAKKYDLKVIWQIGNSYFRPSYYDVSQGIWCTQECENGAAYASSVIYDRHSTHPQIFAFSVKEEPQDDFTIMSYLMNYYEKVINKVVQRGGDNQIPLFLLHNQTGTAEFIQSNYTGYETNVPKLTGSDRYFMSRDDHYLFNPNKALNLFNNSSSENTNKGLSAFRKKKLEPQAFVSVISGNSQIMNDENGTPNNELPGFNYYAPKYAMRAQVWLSVANGSHGILAWSADVLDQKANRYLKISNMVGADNRGHRTLFEYTEAVRELQKFGWIINRADNPKKDHSILAGNDTMIVSHSLNIDGMTSGKVYVVVNKRISIDVGEDSENLNFNEHGELSEESFPPSVAGRLVRLHDSVDSIFDIATGREYNANDNQLFLKPGGGRMLFKGSREELDELRRKSGITSTYKISGSLQSDLNTDYSNKRIVFPAAPVHGRGSYVIDDGLFREREIELDRRYRLHVSVNGNRGASFQARVFGYKNGVQTVSDDIGIRETVLNSTMTNISSDDFSISSTESDTARIYFYHQNKLGELTIHDAWLEDVSNETSFSSYYKINYGVSLSPNKTYRVYVEAKELENEESNIAVRYLAFNSSDQLVETQDIEGVPWGTELTKDFQFITTDKSIFRVNRSDVAYIRIAIYRPNKSMSPSNKIVLRNVWVEDVL